MKRRVISAMMAVMTAAMLAGCGGSDSASDSSTSGSGSDSADAKESVLKDGTVDDIVIVYPGASSAPASLEAVEAGISEIVQETVDANVKLQILEWGVFSEQENLMLSSGEDVDIVFLVNTVKTSATSGQIIDISGYMDTYAADAQELMGKYIEACYIEDALYGLPTYHEYAQRGGLVCSTELLNETGYSAEDITTWEDVEAVLAKVQELHPDIDVLVPPESQQGMMKYYWGGTFDDIVSDMVGVYMDGSDGLSVHNIYDTDEFMELAQTAYDWNQKGYFIADANTITETRQTFLKSGSAFGYIGLVHPGTVTQETVNAGIDITAIPITERGCGTNNVAGIQYCVTNACDTPEKAVAVLNLIYSNADIQNYLRYGIEGTDYEKISDTKVGYPDGVDSSNAGWNNETWVTGNGSLAYAWETDPDDVWEEYADFNDNAVFSPAYGFSFDTTNVKTEITACTNVMDKYIAMIYSGLSDPEESVAAFNEELESAGINVIIEEVQSQLDEWAETQE